MLTEEQIETIAYAWYEQDVSGQFDEDGNRDEWDERDSFAISYDLTQTAFIAEKAIAIQAEQDRRSFIAVGKYVGVKFTAGTDVVSEVYAKLDEIMTVFREHSQEIAIAQSIKILTNQLEKYLAHNEPPTIP